MYWSIYNVLIVDCLNTLKIENAKNIGLLVGYKISLDRIVFENKIRILFNVR